MNRTPSTLAPLSSDEKAILLDQMLDRHSFRLGNAMPEGIAFARAALHCWRR